MLTRNNLYWKLCTNDRRHPMWHELHADDDPEDAREPGINCFCDNCFYSRHDLADALLAAWDRIEELEGQLKD